MAAPAPAAQPSGGGNVLTQKLGPLATWVWLLIATIAIVIYYLIAKYRAGKSGTTTATGQAAPGQTAGVQDVPDIILQNYTQQEANPTVNVPAPAGSTPPPQPAPTPAPPPVQPGGPPQQVKPPPVSTPPKPKPSQPPIFNSTYTVRAGDTLNSLSSRLGISRVELAHANGLGTGAGLRTGQKLKVPAPAPGGKPNKAQ